MTQAHTTSRRLLLAALFGLAALVAGCGGTWQGWPVDSDSSQGTAVDKVIMFGDSLSDVGTYAGATAGQGGKFTINPDLLWIERIAATAGRTITPYVVGYGSDQRNWLICPQAACYGYAQGGARITAANGIGNEDGSQSGALTFPVTTQIADHLAANNNRFAGNDLVFVFAGSNDVLFQQALYARTVAANPLRGSSAARATAEAAMTTAASELTQAVRSQVVARGAGKVVLFTLPSISLTPLGQQFNTASGRELLDGLTNVFNAALRQGISDNGLDVLLFDANAWFRQVYQSPASFDLINTTDSACDVAKIASATAGTVTDGSALFCNRSTLVSGAQRDERYAFADFLHPTPVVHKAFADAVTASLRERNWIAR